MARYVPDRGEIVWLDFEPTRGGEIGRYRPALVLSSSLYNRKTGLLICCPISSGIRGGTTEVAVTRFDYECVVATNLVHTLDWRERKAKKAADSDPALLQEVVSRLLPLLGAEP